MTSAPSCSRPAPWHHSIKGSLTMPKLKVSSFAISLDGFSAGPDQSLENPLGVNGPEMFEWFFATNVWKQMHGLGAGETGIDNAMAEASFHNIGAWILG